MTPSKCFVTAQTMTPIAPTVLGKIGRRTYQLMMTNMENLETTPSLLEWARQNGIQSERMRIVAALFAANLPVGVWPLIKDIINPEINQQQ